MVAYIFGCNAKHKNSLKNYIVSRSKEHKIIHTWDAKDINSTERYALLIKQTYKSWRGRLCHRRGVRSGNNNVRVHHMFLRILNFLYLIVFSRKKSTYLISNN